MSLVVDRTVTSIYCTEKETYLYVHGLSVSEEVQISENAVLMPVKCKLPLMTVSEILDNEVDFAISILCSESIVSQLRITAEVPEDVGLIAWNSQWDLVLLSAIFNCDIISNIQCTHSIEKIAKESTLHITNYHLRGLFGESYILTAEDKEWINKYFSNAQFLLDNDSFMTATHSMSSYRWHSMPRVQLAILWAGIESLFRINNELSFRISLYIAKFLGNKDSNEEKRLFDEVKSLYKSRSSAVHGDNIKGDINSLVTRSATLLNKLIVKCIETNELPNVESLIYK